MHVQYRPKLSEQYYVKIVLGKWFDPRLKKVVDVYALTHEMTQDPIREKILVMELLKDFPGAGSFSYYDEQREEYVEGMVVYPQVKIGTGITKSAVSDVN